MNLAEVVIHEVQRDGMRVHFDLLGEGIGQPGKSAHVHPHREVLPLDVAGRDVPFVRVACDRGRLDARNLRWRVAVGRATCVDEAPVVLFEHGVVHVDTEGVVHGIQVDFQLVGRKLDSVSQTRSYVLHEVVADGGGPLTKHVGNDQLAVGVDSRPRPDIAPLSAFVVRHVLGLGSDEAPNLVALNPLALEAPHMGIVVGRAGRPQVAEQLFHGHAGDAGQTSGSSQAVAFNQGGNDGGAAVGAQLIHNRQYTCAGKDSQLAGLEIKIWYDFDMPFDDDIARLYPHIRFSKHWELSGSSTYTLGKCDALVESICELPLQPERRRELLNVSLVKGAQATTAIEGNTLTREEVERVAGHEKLAQSKEYQEREVRNIL